MSGFDSSDMPDGAWVKNKGTIVFERQVSCGVDNAWAAISEKQHLDSWFMVTTIELREGGRFSFSGG
jgi:uncharacterized protein YndB with AHSA1/START domain